MKREEKRINVRAMFIFLFLVAAFIFAAFAGRKMNAERGVFIEEENGRRHPQ